MLNVMTLMQESLSYNANETEPSDESAKTPELGKRNEMSKIPNTAMRDIREKSWKSQNVTITKITMGVDGYVGAKNERITSTNMDDPRSHQDQSADLLSLHTHHVRKLLP